VEALVSIDGGIKEVRKYKAEQVCSAFFILSFGTQSQVRHFLWQQRLVLTFFWHTSTGLPFFFSQKKNG
jgi:hypothetical protein